jgi:protein phosphatase PTC7
MAIAGRSSTPFNLVISTTRVLRIPRATFAYLFNSKSAQLRSFHSSHPWSSKPRVSYRIAGSCSAKGHRFNVEKNTYNFDPAVRNAIGLATGAKDRATKKRKTRPDSGEDAFFVSQVGSTDSGAVAFAVADGVGGWAESKVDPADFSHGLCRYMAQEALFWDATERLRAKDLLQMGYDGVVGDDSVTAGGSTACVGVAQSDGTVELAK